MAIDMDTEEIITLGEACRLVPPNGISMPTITRWTLHQVRGATLETIIIGGRRLTSKEALARFFATQNAPKSSAPVVSKSQRQREAETADRVLAEQLS